MRKSGGQEWLFSKFAPRRPAGRFRETLTSLVLGTLALSLGLLFFVVEAASACGYPMWRWQASSFTIVEEPIPEFRVRKVLTSEGRAVERVEQSHAIKASKGVTYLLPSPECFSFGFLGFVLGAIGVVKNHRATKGGLSPTSLSGAALSAIGFAALLIRLMMLEAGLLA